MTKSMDIVTVVHNDRNCRQARSLRADLAVHGDLEYEIIVVDNSVNNRGFGPACNLGASQGSAPIVGFLNPDAEVTGSFMQKVVDIFDDDSVVITGENFGKPEWEYRMWGCVDWVCGAAFFVRRSWFEAVGGFDDRYLWGWEETDLIRLAQDQGNLLVSIELPIRHVSPTTDSLADQAYKAAQFDRGSHLFYSKWGPSWPKR